jgi:diguanylate cyclase (GGDEF)-like protein
MRAPQRHSRLVADEGELETLVRHVALADWLVLAVVVLYQLVTPQHGFPVAVIVASGLFGAVSIALRLPRLIASPRLALELEAWSMTGYVAVIAWVSGGLDSPLQSLYLLPIVLASLVFSTGRLVLQLIAVASAYLLVALLGPGATLPLEALAGRALAGVGPLLVVAWLTSKLGSALLAARRRAAALQDGDPLTGLATRQLLIERLTQELADPERRDQPCSVLIIDLEGAHRINEQFGTEAGNAALRLVAEAMRRVLRETDIAARWGGDEFAALLAGAEGDEAQSAAKRIRHAVYSTTLDAGPRLVRCAVSIGVAAAPRDGRSADFVLATAERRLERERELRRQSAAASAAGQSSG